MIRMMLVGAVLLAAPSTSFLDTVHASADQAKEQVFAVVSYGLGSAYCPGHCKAVPVKARADVARAAVAFAKTYLASDDFKQRYATQWAESEPRAPDTVEAQLRRQADEKKQQDADAVKNEAELKEKAASEKDPAMKKIYQDALKAQSEMKAMMSSPEQKAAMEQLQKVMLEQLKRQYDDDKVKFDQAHAEWLTQKDPKVLIRKRIDAFLDLSSTVDFKAKTTTKDGRTSFKDEANEQKSSQWKQLYRLGREATDALRTAAKSWKAEL